MPVDFFGTNKPSKLRLGRGIKGGAAALPPLGGPSSALELPPGMPRRPVVPLQAQTPPPSPLPPLSGAFSRPGVPMLPGGAGHPIDVTTPGVRAAPQYAGEALLRRSVNQMFPSASTATAGKGVKKAVELLRNPDKLYDPKNKKQLDLLTHPGPVVQNLIAADPHLKDNYQGLTQHLIDKGPVKLPAQDMIKKLQTTYGAGKMSLQDFVTKNKLQLAGMTDEEKMRFSKAVDVATLASRQKNLAAGKANVAGVGAPVQRVLDTGLWQNAVNQGMEMAIGTVPGMVQMVKDPKGSLKAMAHSTADYYSPLFHGDFSKFGHNVYQNPLTLPMDALAAYSAGAGTFGRLGAVSKASSELAAATATEDLGAGATKVGGRYGVHPQASGRYIVRDTHTNKFTVGGNFPDEASAIAHAKSLGYEGAHRNAFVNAAHAFTHPELYGKTRGQLLDIFAEHNGKAAARRVAEDHTLMESLKGMADDPALNLGRKGVFSKDAWRQAKRDIDVSVHDFRTAGGLGKAGSAYKELISGVRHSAIYLRPAYLPNNWAGNTFMNMVHQGVLAPVNLAKSVVLYKHMDARNLAMMRKATGATPAQVLAEGSGKGVVSGALHPLTEDMSRLADQPFRDAAFLHEARRMGLTKVKQVDDLFNTARAGGEAGDAAYAKIARIGNKAQEEVVKFKDLNPTERAMAQNGLFVWNWVRGSARYTARFPFQHPIQSAAIAHTAPVGNEWVNKQTGGLPWFMAGSIPVGKDKDGNPIMINPFALNPLGSGIQFAQQMAGSWKAIHHPETFNKYQDPTLLDSLNPVLGSAVGHMSGATSKPFMSDIEKQMAPVNLINQLRHPGSGSIYPTTRQEALGHYIFGALYPRKASQETITATLQRELRSNPIDLYNLQASQYQKATGEAVPPELAVKVKGDLDAMQHIKDFQKHYASTKGSTGFRSLPATDQLTAAIQYLEEHHKMAPADIEDFKKAAVTPGVDEATMKKLANAAWGATGAGVYKRKWEEIYGRTVKTKLRPSRG